MRGVVYASNANTIWEYFKERFDKLDGSRTYNLHQENFQITQGAQSIFVYFSKLKSLWDEFESMMPSPTCNFIQSKYFIFYLQRQKFYQFLMGLNEYYSMVVSDENQKVALQLVTSIGLLGIGPEMIESALYSKFGNQTKKGYNSSYNPNATRYHCKLKGHGRTSSDSLGIYLDIPSMLSKRE